MNLNNEKEKIKFLKECSQHISRIFRSKKQKKVDVDPEDAPNLIEKDSLDNGNLPKSYSLTNNVLSSLKIGKLNVLIEIYNKVAERNDFPIDLNIIFADIKNQLNVSLKIALNFDANEILRTHRNKGMRIFKPASTTFLEKYGYFQDSSNNKKINLP